MLANVKSELDVLRDVSAKLNSAGIPFMLTGSVAMSYYAQLRMTRLGSEFCIRNTVEGCS